MKMSLSALKLWLIIVLLGALLVFVAFNSFGIVKYNCVVYKFTKPPGLIVYPLNVTEPETPDTPCTRLKTKYAGATPICVYTEQYDDVISASILRTGQWEPHLTAIMEELFRRDPNLNLVDIGSNVGAFTVTALKSGRQVIAVDPKPGNLRRIRMSIRKGNLTGGILVRNGLSDLRTTATFHQHPSNNGKSYLTDSEFTDTSRGEAVRKFEVKTILLIDLISLVAFRRAMIKIDVEGFEKKVFQTLGSFLEEVDVPFILMEWVWVQASKSAKPIITLMRNLGYRCFVAEVGGAPCADGDHNKWPLDIVWIRTNADIYSGAAEAIRIWTGSSTSAPSTG